MSGRLAATCAAVAGISLFVFVSVVTQYADPIRLAPFIAFVLVAMIIAFAGAGGARVWWQALAISGAILVGCAAIIWPRPPVILNYLAIPLLAAGVVAIVLAAILRSGVATRAPVLAPPSLPPAIRPAMLWVSAVAMAVATVFALFAINPIGAGFLVAAVGLAIASVASLRSAPRRRTAGATAILSTAIPLLAAQALFLSPTAPDRRYEISGSYQGWVIVKHSSDCPALRKESGTLVFTIDQRGCGCTSTPEPEGWSHWTYVRVGADGRRTELRQTGFGGGGLIWAGFGGSAVINGVQVDGPSGFFVGTEDELNRSWLRQRDEESLCLGPP